MLTTMKKLAHLRLSSSLFFPKSDRDKILLSCLSKSDSCTKVKFSSFENESKIDKNPIDDVDKKLEMLKMEHILLLEKGENVPTSVSDKDWQELLDMNYGERINYFRFLYKNEDHFLNTKRIKIEKQATREQLFIKKDEVTGDHIRYGLFRNSMFLHISSQRMTLTYSSWFQLSALTFGQIMVIDLDYDHLMTEQELKNAADQIQLSYALNKVSRFPWNLYMCNAKPDNLLLKRLKLAIPNLEAPNCLITVTEKSYLDIFPREKLIYLSGNSSKVMGKIDHDAIYIIGGFVDKTNPIPASIAKAKKEGITALQLPLKRYLPIETRKNNLTINQVTGILIDLKASGKWDIALKHVPERKYKSDFGSSSKVSRSSPNRNRTKFQSLFHD